MKKIILVLILSSLFSTISAQKAQLNPQTTRINLAPFSSILDDSSASLSFEQVQKKNFTPYQNDKYSFPFSDHVFWLKFTLDNKINVSKEWVLKWENGMVEHVDFYIPQADGSYQIIKEGNVVYKPQNLFVENLPTIRFNIHDAKEYTFYIRVESQRGHNSMLEIFSPASFYDVTMSKFKREGFFNGLFVLRLFYVLLLAFFIVKDKTFKRYSLLVILRSLAYWGIMGILGNTLTKDPTLAKQINIFPYYILPVAYVLVLKSVLAIERFPKIITTILNVIFVITIALSLCIIIDYKWYWLKVSTYVMVFSMFLSIGLFIVSVIKKYAVDWSYSIPYLLGVLGNLYLPLRLLGVKDFPGTYAISSLCFVIEIFVFGLFLGRIIRDYEKNKISTENELVFNREQASKLQELDTLKTSFFANISHEFRTPLTLILSPLDDLQKEFPKREIFQTMKRNANRLLALINQLLDLSKLEAKQMKPEVTEVELVKFFRTLNSSFSSLAESRGISFDIEQNKKSILGYIDKDKIEKILTNLLSNAFKFTKNGGNVKVNISYNSEKSNQVKIEIQDTGIGISKEKMNKIFDRFYQIDTSQNRGYEGTGIGLSLVKELVGVLNGTIQVESQENIGTKFTVKLPIDKETWKDNIIEIVDRKIVLEDFKIIEKPVDLPIKNSNINENILLIVDDNADIRTYIRSVFEKDYQIIEAINGKDGIEKATEKTPNLIISDLMMPEMDGFEFCKTLKTDEKTSHIPVIMLTAKANIESRIEGLELGADDYLIKPFNATEIQVRVKNLIEKQDKLRQYFNGKVIELKPNEIKVNAIEEVFIKKAKSILENHLSDNTFTAEQFSQEMNMSQSQLLRKLKALTNLTINEFIRDFRLQRAAKLLSNKSANVSEIAYMTGFESLSYFSKVFQEKYGKLPSEYS